MNLSKSFVLFVSIVYLLLVSNSYALSNPDENKKSKYLKKEGDRWSEYEKTPTNLFLINSNAPAPSQESSPNNLNNAMSISTSLEAAVNVEKPIFGDPISTDVGSWPEAVAIGDINNDGRKDVAMVTSYYFDTSNDYKLFVFLQNTNGQLNPPVKYNTSGTYTAAPNSVQIGDFNHDGLNDVAVGLGQSIAIYLQNSSGTLSTPVTYATSNSLLIRAGDFNNDGLTDIAGISWANQMVDVFLQNSIGTLSSLQSYPVSYAGYNDLEAGDINADGLTDIIVMSGQGLGHNLGVVTQNNLKTFNSPMYFDLGSRDNGHGVAIGDFNDDKNQDILVAYGGNKPSSNIGIFYQNNLTHSLNPSVSQTSYDIPESVESGDINNDGKDDVVVLHGGWQRMGLYLQDPTTGKLLDEKLYPIPYASHYNPQGIALGDINNDGLTDAAIADYGSGLVVLYNQIQLPVNGETNISMCYRGRTTQVPAYLKARYIAKGATEGACL